MENIYRLDRTQAAKLTFSEADDHVTYWLSKTEDERLNAACFIINQVFEVSAKTKVDRTQTDRRKQS